MGQYGNQPDFGTRAKAVTPSGNLLTGSTDLGSAALYIGVGGTLCVNLTGGQDGFVTNTTVFTNVPSGTFMPIIVRNVYADNEDGIETTCSGIVALY